MFDSLTFIKNQTILDPLTVYQNRVDGGLRNVIQNIGWEQIGLLNMLRRNWFPGELIWQQNDACAGYKVSEKPDCPYRAKEMQLFMFTPEICVDSMIEGCENLVAYARVNIKNTSILTAMLQFGTTIFTSIILAVGSIMFSNDTQKIIIEPITKMVSIIKTLADDPL